MYVSGRTLSPRDRIELPLGVWIVDEMAATFSGDEPSRLLDADDYGGTLVCRPAAS